MLRYELHEVDVHSYGYYVTMIYTIGHSNQSIDTFIRILKGKGVEILVDVRSNPYSSYARQFNVGDLSEELDLNNIEYLPMPDLGGIQGVDIDSEEFPDENLALTDPRFRNFADYTRTDTFKSELSDLISISDIKTTCIMCSEADWNKCHRRIISDNLIARGVEVIHLRGSEEVKAKLTPEAVVHGNVVRYPELQLSLF